MSRQPRARLSLLAAALVATLVVGSPAAGQSAPPGDHALADDTLRAAVAHRGSGQEASGGVEVTDDRIRVEILHHSDTATVTSMVEAVGGTIDGDVPGVLVEGEVPWTALADLEATEAIDFIHQPESVSVPLPSDQPAQSGAELGFSSQELQKTRADTWHRAGQRASGVRIGVVDVFDQATWDAARAEGEVKAPAGTFCRIQGSSSCSVWDADEEHGVAVVEILNDMAPAAGIYLAYVDTTADFQAAMDWFSANDVDIVTRSLTSPYDGPGDGTGPIATVIDNAVTQGMTFIQAAGNAAGRTTAPAVEGSYLRWEYVDADADGRVEFAPGDERLTVDCGFLNGLRWDDFDDTLADISDYDLYVYNGAGTVLQHTSLDDQQGGAPPIEHTADCTTSQVQIEVQLDDPGAGGADGDVLELLMNNVGFEHWTNPGSAAGPAADTANPGALTVGAIDPWNGFTAGFYSSQGPTNDQRVKPDLVAASCVSSFVYTPQCFGGTSAAAPVTAGAAALYLGSQPTATPTDITTWLTDTAVSPRGNTGEENIYGAGELILPSMGPRPRYRPDAAIAIGQGRLVGSYVYSSNGARQTATARGGPSRGVLYRVAITNRGDSPERLVLAGSRSALGYRIRYGNSDTTTRRVVNGHFYTRVLQPDQWIWMNIVVTIPRSARPGTGLQAQLAAYSNSNFTTKDVVRFITIRR